MGGWQYKAAFVIQIHSETNIEAGQFEGKVEHVASCRATRFHSLDELLAFIGCVLADVENAGGCGDSIRTLFEREPAAKE